MLTILPINHLVWTTVPIPTVIKGILELIAFGALFYYLWRVIVKAIKSMRSR